MNLFAVGLAIAYAAIAAEPYTMNDLLALEKSSSWEEIVAHLSDVPPSKRDGEWMRISEKAAIEYTASLAKAQEPFAAYSAIESMGRSYPHLMKIPAFTAKRAEVGLGAFSQCFKQTWSGGECVQTLLGFVDADPKNEELALKAAKMVRLNQFHYVAVPFFLRAVKDKDSKACLDEDLRLAVIAGLGLPSDYDNAKGAKKLAFELCWSALSDHVAGEFHKNSKGSYYFTNTCKELKEKKMLSNLQAKQCS
jgi:hypothetical protein